MAENPTVEESDTPDTPFREAWKEFRRQLDTISSTMDDPFKAPELTIGLLPELMAAIWQFQIEWVVMNRGK